MKAAHEALLDVLTAKYGAPPHFKWGVVRSWLVGGEDPFDQVYAMSCDDELPHWHYVGSGLANPAKVTTTPDDPESGVGYELTFRLRKRGEVEPPIWPVTRLQELGWGILKHDMRIGAGHYIRQRKPLSAGEVPSKLTGYYVLSDEQLPLVKSASGHFGFLVLVGVTEEELVRCEGGDADGVGAALRAASPLGVTDIGR